MVYVIDEEKTFREKGYYSTDLKPQSNKLVFTICEGEDCQREGGRCRWVRFSAYHKLCHGCAQKKRRIDELQRSEISTEKLPWIDDDITYAEKGYRSTWLKPYSEKMVWAICANTECKREGGRGRWVMFGHCYELCHICAMKKMRKHNYDNIENIVRSIDEEKTFAEKGYRSTDLSAQSGKKVYAICMECGYGRWVMFSAYCDLCVKCANGTEEKRKKASDTHKGDKCYNWKGGISFYPYCEKFNEAFKESVREKFGRKCFACDKTEEENVRKLCVHHVNYDKDCMCNDVDCEFVPLCMGCHVRTNYDRELWERLIINTLDYEGWI